MMVPGTNPAFLYTVGSASKPVPKIVLSMLIVLAVTLAPSTDWLASASVFTPDGRVMSKKLTRSPVARCTRAVASEAVLLLFDSAIAMGM